MAFGIATALSKYDSFGSWAKFNYRGESGYGTGIGGCCSIIVTLITIFFVGLQFWGFVFQASYNQSTTTLYKGVPPEY